MIRYSPLSDRQREANETIARKRQVSTGLAVQQTWAFVLLTFQTLHSTKQTRFATLMVVYLVFFTVSKVLIEKGQINESTFLKGYMMKSEFIGFRADANEREKIERMARAAGMNTSEILRALVAAASLEPVQRFEPVVRLGNREAVQQ